MTTEDGSLDTPSTPDRFGFFPGGSQYTPHELVEDPNLVLRRERKWLKMLANWDKYMEHHFETVKRRCRKGIPRSVRGRAWFHLCGAHLLQKRYPALYAELKLREGPKEAVADIKKDIHRQLPHHEFFADGNQGPEVLFEVLKAFAVYSNDYCQAQAPLAATLLLHLPEEECFWALVAICSKYMTNYYGPGLPALVLDASILVRLLKQVSPSTHKVLTKSGLAENPELMVSEWFLCIFSRTLPWLSVLRVFDIFLCEGVKVLFRVGLVLLKGSGIARQDSDSMYDILNALKNLPPTLTQEQALIHAVLHLDLSDDQIRKAHHKTVKRKLKQ